MKIVRSPGLPRGFSLFDGDPAPIALRPLVLAAGETGGEDSRPLAGGPLVFESGDLLLHDRDEQLHVCRAALADMTGWADAAGPETATELDALLERLSAPRAAFAGVALDRPRLMGIVNVTPDSFYHGGRHADPDAAIAHARALIAAGTDIVDIGGESTRPGSAPISEDEECARVLPVIRALVDGAVPVSVDTRKTGVMRAAFGAGACIVNDVTALADDGAIAAVAEAGASAVLMHMRGTPETMQRNPEYDHAPYEVYRFLSQRVTACAAAGIAPDRLAADPGIGFGKTAAHNFQLLGALSLLHGLGTAVLLGASRKSFISRSAGGSAGADRLPGSLAAALLAAAQGVQILRVHDVAETRQALDVWQFSSLARP